MCADYFTNVGRSASISHIDTSQYINNVFHTPSEQYLDSSLTVLWCCRQNMWDMQQCMFSFLIGCQCLVY